MSENDDRKNYNKMIKRDFLSLMKNTRTKDFLTVLAEFSFEMYKLTEPIITIKLNNSDYSLYLFQIHYLAYYSIKNGNDHKNSDNAENNNYKLTAFIAGNKFINFPAQNVSTDNIWSFLTGQTPEQFSLQEYSWIGSAINRMQHLLTSNGKNKADLTVIIKHFFNCNLQEYWQSILLISLLNAYSIYPLKVFKDSKLEENFPDSFVQLENIPKIMHYFSCTYANVRESPLGPQIFYAKPFIQLEDGEYLCINPWFFLILLFNSFYHLSIDYHRIKSKKMFEVFGDWFEDYLVEIVAHYHPDAKMIRIPEKKEESADFILRLGNYILLIECKSAPIHIMAKSQQPYEQNLRRYILGNVVKAYSQLNQSFNREFLDNEKGSVLKIILSGENSPYIGNMFIKGACYETGDAEIDSVVKEKAQNFSLDTRALFVTIRELEILLSLDLDDFNHVIDHVLSQGCRQSLLQAMEELKPKIPEETFFTGSRNYFDIAIGDLKSALGLK